MRPQGRLKAGGTIGISATDRTGSEAALLPMLWGELQTALAPQRVAAPIEADRGNVAVLCPRLRNKGAPGVDGQTVEMAEAKAPPVIAGLRRDLLTGEAMSTP
jgi:hypothetical protein